MTPKTILAYQFGSAHAIRAAAANRATMPTALFLVLCTAVARNYDQTWFLDTSLWLFGGLMVSLVSGTLLYLVLRSKFLDAQKAPLELVPWMALFWLTAPTGWLYAIPVERLLDRTGAATANAVLLGIVALWRVLLITRVVSVVRSAPFRMVLPWVLFGALVETFLVIGISGVFGRRLLAGMMGMRNAPEEEVVIGIANMAAMVSMYAIIPMFIVAVIVTRGRNYQGSPAFPLRAAGKLPVIFLIGCGVAWSAVAISPQMELARNREVEAMAREKRFADAVRFMSERLPGDFCPAKRLPPNPFEMSVYKELPGFFAHFDGGEAPWVREHCLTALLELFDPDADEWAIRGTARKIGAYPDEWESAFRAMTENPACREWMARHGARVSRIWECVAEEDAMMPSDRRRTFRQLFGILGIPRPVEVDAAPAR